MLVVLIVCASTAYAGAITDYVGMSPPNVINSFERDGYTAPSKVPFPAPKIMPGVPCLIFQHSRGSMAIVFFGNRGYVSAVMVIEPTGSVEATSMGVMQLKMSLVNNKSNGYNVVNCRNPFDDSYGVFNNPQKKLSFAVWKDTPTSVVMLAYADSVRGQFEALVYQMN